MKNYTRAFDEHLAVAPMSDFVEQVGFFFDRFGFRRNLGRIWATLYLAPEALSQAQLAELLGLSAGLVSSALKDLEHWQMVRVVQIRGSRTHHYEAEEQLLRTVAAILAKRELEAVARLREAASEVRLAYSPGRGNSRLDKRLRAVENVTDLYEVLAKMIGTMARLPMGVLEQTKRAVELGRKLESMAQKALPRAVRAR